MTIVRLSSRWSRPSSAYTFTSIMSINAFLLSPLLHLPYFASNDHSHQNKYHHTQTSYHLTNVMRILIKILQYIFIYLVISVLPIYELFIYAIYLSLSDQYFHLTILIRTLFLYLLNHFVFLDVHNLNLIFILVTFVLQNVTDDCISVFINHYLEIEYLLIVFL